MAKKKILILQTNILSILDIFSIPISYHILLNPIFNILFNPTDDFHHSF